MIQSIEEYKYEYPKWFLNYTKKNKIDNLIPPEQKSLTVTLNGPHAYANAIRRTINGETSVKILHFELKNFKCNGVQGNKELIPIEIQRRLNNIVVDQSIDIKSSFKLHVSNNTHSSIPVYSSSIVNDRKKDIKYFSDNCKLFDLPQYSDVHIDNIIIEENTALNTDNMCYSFNGKVGYEMVNKEEFKLHIKRQEYCDPMYILKQGIETLNNKFQRYIDIIKNDEESKELEIENIKISNLNYLSFKFNGESETMSYLLFKFCYNVDNNTPRSTTISKVVFSPSATNLNK
jgi:DNA-directed RNA polymerase subunit L